MSSSSSSSVLIPMRADQGDESPLPPMGEADTLSWLQASANASAAAAAAAAEQSGSISSSRTSMLPPGVSPASSFGLRVPMARRSSSTTSFSSDEESEDYGSDDELKELDRLTLPELKARCASLMRAAAKRGNLSYLKNSTTSPKRGAGLASRRPSAALSPGSPRSSDPGQPPASPVHLHPSVYTVHTSSVKRMKLGRTASIATRNAINTLPFPTSMMPSTPPIPSAGRRLGRISSIVSTGEDFPSLSSQFSSVARASHFVHRPLDKSSAYAASEAFAEDLLELCRLVTPVLEKEERVLQIKSPVYVFGDIHGNLEDLRFFSDKIWPLNMSLSAGSFLFLGDYVDRGSFGLEVVAYLLAQKVTIPEKIFLLRGNHETRSVNGWEDYYGDGSFVAQCRNRFGRVLGQRVWEECNKVFDRLPLAAIVDKQIFCVHGGIPRPSSADGPDTRLEEIRAIPCPIAVRQPGPMHPGRQDTFEERVNRLAFALLWSDPADSKQETMLEGDSGFGNSVRGSGSVVFGTRAVEKFLANFKLKYIMRAHEATANGVNVSKSAKVLTVFSTSKDHGCGENAKCGCVLVDARRIVAILRAPDYGKQAPPSPGSPRLALALEASGVDLGLPPPTTQAGAAEAADEEELGVNLDVRANVMVSEYGEGDSLL